MRSLITNTFDVLRRSLWFIPTIMALGGLALAVSLNYLDHYFWSEKLPYLGEAWGVSYDGVRTLFTSVGGAIIAALTTILSITLLIFTVLSGQYGAHVLRVFKVRTFSKFVIGWFSAVYIYILYHVYTLTVNGEADYIPQLSITLGGIFTLSTIFLIILYIHFLVRQIQVGTVVTEISKELFEKIQSIEVKEPKETNEEQIFLPEEIDWVEEAFSLDSYGYVQNIDQNELENIAEENNFVIKIHHRPGDFIVTGEIAVEIYSESKVDESVIEAIKKCIVLGEKRIPVEDLEYYVEILAEMTVKALSPGFNNIFVANNCIDHIGQSLALIANRQFPAEYRHGKDGKLLLILKEFSFEGYMNAILNPLRQYSKDHCSVTLKLMDNLIKMVKLTEQSERVSTIERHFLAIYHSASEQHKENIDLKCLNERRQAFLNAASQEVKNKKNDK